MALNADQIVKKLKAGAVIIVRAKNGDCIPMFNSKPDAYRCTLGAKEARHRAGDPWLVQRGAL